MISAVDDDASESFVYRNGKDSRNRVTQKDWMELNASAQMNYARLLRTVAPCPGHDPPLPVEMKACSAVNDLLWTLEVREDLDDLCPEVGAIIKGGPEYKKGMIVSPDVSRMQTRYDDYPSIGSWLVVWLHQNCAKAVSAPVCF